MTNSKTISSLYLQSERDDWTSGMHNEESEPGIFSTYWASGLSPKCFHMESWPRSLGCHKQEFAQKLFPIIFTGRWWFTGNFLTMNILNAWEPGFVGVGVRTLT